jgi:hypothetical protein
MEKRFSILRFVGSIYKILGVIVAVLTILGAIGFCGTSLLGGAAMERISQDLGTTQGLGPGVGIFSGAVGGVIVGLVILIAGVFNAVTFYAFGEGISLFLALEENTRATNLLLQRQLSVPVAAAVVHPPLSPANIT